jgi:hypothetical protein
VGVLFSSPQGASAVIGKQKRDQREAHIPRHLWAWQAGTKNSHLRADRGRPRLNAGHPQCSIVGFCSPEMLFLVNLHRDPCIQRVGCLIWQSLGAPCLNRCELRESRARSKSTSYLELKTQQLAAFTMYTASMVNHVNGFPEEWGCHECREWRGLPWWRSGGSWWSCEFFSLPWDFASSEESRSTSALQKQPIIAIAGISRRAQHSGPGPGKTDAT